MHLIEYPTVRFHNTPDTACAPARVKCDTIGVMKVWVLPLHKYVIIIHLTAPNLYDAIPPTDPELPPLLVVKNIRGVDLNFY